MPRRRFQSDHFHDGGSPLSPDRRAAGH
jgi:hypothetical protein